VRPDPALFLLGTLERGGSETKFVRLANRLSRKNMPVHLAWLRGPETLLPEIEASVVAHPLRSGRSLSVPAWRRLRRAIREHHVGSLVCVNFLPMLYGWPAALPGRTVRLLASINTTDFQGPQNARFMTLYAPLMRKMDSVVFGSCRQRLQWQQQYRLRADSSTVVHNGVDLDRYVPPSAEERRRHRESLGVSADETVYISVAQLRPEKGHVQLIEAFSRVVASRVGRLILVGDGVQRETLVEVARDRGVLGRVIFAGEQPDVRSWLALADVFVLASTAVETFSNAALEAAACGLPVIMTDIGGASELIGEQGAQWLVRVGNVDDLAEKMLRLGCDADLRAVAGRNARNRIEKNFTAEHMDSAWSEILWSSTEKRRGADT
jgi:glycosyltransferase involved in cell wall biosynthesis